MRRIVTLLMLLTLFLVTTGAALAEDREWKSDVPKQGMAGFSLCTGYAEAGGHSYRNTNYIDNEILANCDWIGPNKEPGYARTDVARYFLFHHGIELDPSAVKVTVSKP